MKFKYIDVNLERIGIKTDIWHIKNKAYED